MKEPLGVRNNFMSAMSRTSRSLISPRQWQRGQTIIEVIIATGIVALVMTAIVSVITVSIVNTAQAKSRSLGTKYGQEAMEFFRRQRSELGWETFVSTIEADGSSVSYCLTTIPATTQAFQNLTHHPCVSTNTNDYVVDQGRAKIFQRQADMTVTTSGTSKTVYITVNVTWQEGDQTRTSKVAQKFEEWGVTDVPTAPSPSPGAPAPP